MTNEQKQELREALELGLEVMTEEDALEILNVVERAQKREIARLADLGGGIVKALLKALGLCDD